MKNDEKEKLLRKHATELAYLESRVKSASASSPSGLGSKKKLGSAIISSSPTPQSPAAQKAAAAFVELQTKHIKELEELETRLLQVSIKTELINTSTERDDKVNDIKTNDVDDNNDNDKSGDVNGDDEDKGVDDTIKTSTSTMSSSSPILTRSGTKAQRRREQRAAEFAALRSDTTESTTNLGPSMRDVEMQALEKVLKPLGFGIKLMAADGNCMFRAIADQLRLKYTSSSFSSSSTTSSSSSSSSSLVIPDYQTLRSRASEYITVHWNLFAPFLPYDSSDKFPEEENNQEAIKEAVKRYCSRLKTTNIWGGHPELRALSATIGVPIIVYRANASPLVFEPDGDEVNLSRDNKHTISDSALRISFHAHYLTLGEHYNSVV